MESLSILIFRLDKIIAINRIRTANQYLSASPAIGGVPSEPIFIIAKVVPQMRQRKRNCRYLNKILLFNIITIIILVKIT